MTFGCSHVFGHGLPDCITLAYEEDKDSKTRSRFHAPGEKPSQFAWPSLLAEKLNRECLNLSEPGSSNLTILMEILKCDFKPDDLVIIGFTYFGRYNCHIFVDKAGSGNVIGKNTEDHRKMILADMGIKNSELREYWYNWLTIHHAMTYLKSINVKSFFHVGPLWDTPDSGERIKPDMLEFDNFLDDVKLVYRDFALDNMHQGLESHRLQSELIYNRIKDRI